jgi:hypothetical protein
MIRQLDEAQLRFASQRERALYSFNVADFCRIHASWIEAGIPLRTYSGPAAAPLHRRSTSKAHAPPPPSPLRSCENVSSSSMCGPKNMADAARISGGQAIKTLLPAFNPRSAAQVTTLPRPDHHPDQPCRLPQRRPGDPPPPAHLPRHGDPRPAPLDRHNPPEQIAGAHGRVRVQEGVTTGNRGFARQSPPAGAQTAACSG